MGRTGSHSFGCALVLLASVSHCAGQTDGAGAAATDIAPTLAYARMGDKQKAIDLLESIAVVGFPAPIANDPDLASLIGEPRFQALAKAAQQAAEPGKNAQANPEYRQLDFPVGGWNVYSGKQKVGESSVRMILKDCVVFENRSGLQGGGGKSFNKYDLNRVQPASLALNETSTIMLAARYCHLQV